MDTKKQFIESIEARLKILDARLQELSAEAERVRAEAKVELDSQIAKLLANREETKRTLDELKGKSEEAWVDLKDGMEKAWKELKTGIDNAVAKLKSRKQEP